MPCAGYVHVVPTITALERRQLDEQGFVVFREFLGASSVSFIRERSKMWGRRARLQLKSIDRTGISLADSARLSPNELIVVPEANNPTRLCRFEYILGVDAEVASFVAATIAPVINDLLGELFIPFKDKENEKLPGGGGFRPHQDFAAYQEFGPRYNVTAMISIDAATTENGCVEFAINSREIVGRRPEFVLTRIGSRALFHYYRGGAQNGDIRGDIADELEWLPIKTRPADLVLFDSFAPHRSCANHSKSARRAIFITFNARREGDWYSTYYRAKRLDYANPKFHISTPTVHMGLKVGP